MAVVPKMASFWPVKHRNVGLSSPSPALSIYNRTQTKLKRARKRHCKMASDWICIVDKVHLDVFIMPSKQVADHIKLKALN